MFFFTCLLFLSGYVLQQQSVHGLQEALKPRVPAPPPSAAQVTPLASKLKASRSFGGSLGSRAHVAYQQYVKPEAPSAFVDWNKLAHVQLVKDHHSVCNAIMLFGELHRLKSPAKRVLLFPRAWALEKKADKGDVSDPYLDTSRRLMKLAARRYQVELRPVGPVVDGADEGAASSYSLASLYGMLEYDRLMVLSTPGLILDATPLDSILAYAPSSLIATLQPDKPAGINGTELLLAMPDSEAYSVAARAVSLDARADVAVVQGAMAQSLVLDSSKDEERLVASISTLHEADRDFNATAYLSSTAYIRFADPKLPGPEYDVPYSDKVKARPRNKDADWVWTKLYGNFAQKRMDICGLDLEPWRGY